MGIGSSAERVVHLRKHFTRILRVVEAVWVLVALGLLVRESLRFFIGAFERLCVLRVVAATVQPLGLMLLEAGVSLLLVVASGPRVLLGL